MKDLASWGLTPKLARELYDAGGKVRNSLKRACVDMGLALLINWISARSLRIENYANMKLKSNLFDDPQGRWWQFYPSPYTKDRKKKSKPYKAEVTHDLLPDVLFYLNVVRPVLLDYDIENSKYKEYVFINLWGRNYTSGTLGDLYAKSTFRVTGVWSTSHLVRSTNAKFMHEAGFDENTISDNLYNNPETSRNYYMESEQEVSIRRFDAIRLASDCAPSLITAMQDLEKVDELLVQLIAQPTKGMADSAPRVKAVLDRVISHYYDLCKVAESHSTRGRRRTQALAK